MLYFVFIGNTVVFSKLIVAPVASFKFWKYFKTFFTDSWFCRKKFQLSAYCDILTCYFCIWYSYFFNCITIFLFYKYNTFFSQSQSQNMLIVCLINVCLCRLYRSPTNWAFVLKLLNDFQKNFTFGTCAVFQMFATVLIALFSCVFCCSEVNMKRSGNTICKLKKGISVAN